ncbi:Cytochrome P450 CYP305, partial [Frankliniella occidentalis]
RRRCLGEMLARHSLFLFLAFLLHRFTLSPSPDHPIGERHFLDGFTLSPKPLYAVLTPRDLVGRDHDPASSSEDRKEAV